MFQLIEIITIRQPKIVLHGLLVAYHDRLLLLTKRINRYPASEPGKDSLEAGTVSIVFDWESYWRELLIVDLFLCHNSIHALMINADWIDCSAVLVFLQTSLHHYSIVKDEFVQTTFDIQYVTIKCVSH